MLHAESWLNPYAAREGAWPDVSYGMAQITVATAAGYGVGDGSDTPENCAYVKAALFDRTTSIDVGAHHLSGCYGQATGMSEQDLMALIAYNAGSPHPRGDWYWVKYAGNAAAYEAALAWASGVLTGK